MIFREALRQWLLTGYSLVALGLLGMANIGFQVGMGESLVFTAQGERPPDRPSGTQYSPSGSWEREFEVAAIAKAKGWLCRPTECVERGRQTHTEAVCHDSYCLS